MKIIGGILFCCFVIFSSQAFESPTTFQNLDSRLSDEQKLVITAFDRVLILAKNNKEVESALASKIYRHLKDKKVGIDLFRDLYDRYGVDFNNSPNSGFQAYNFYDLADEYIKGESTSPEPVKAIEILLDLAKNGHKPSQFKLGFVLAFSNYFPKSWYLMNVWKNEKKGTKIIYINDVILDHENEFDDFNSLGPDQSLFETCNDSFKKDKRLLKRFKLIQDEIIKNKEINQDILDKAYGRLSQSETIGMQFNYISAEDLLGLFVDIIGTNNGKQMKFKFSDDFSDIKVDIYFKNFPYDVAYQLLLEHLNLQATCYQDWLMFKKEGKKKVVKSTLVANFMTKMEWTNSKTVDIIWDNGVSYQGGFERGMPNGKGKYTYQENGVPVKIIEGYFKNGNLEGQGKEYYIDGKYSVIGDFHNGLLNGQGHFIDQYEQINQNGKFIDGEFQMPKIYEQYFIRDDEKIGGTIPIDLVLKNKKNLINYILYKGPFVDNEPNGKGRCYLKELSYDCTFYKGYLVGIEDFSLLPANIVFGE